MIEMSSTDILKKVNQFMEDYIYSEDYSILCKMVSDQIQEAAKLTAVTNQYEPETAIFIQTVGKLLDSKPAIQNLIKIVNPCVLLSFQMRFYLAKHSLETHAIGTKWNVSENLPDFIEDVLIGYVCDCTFLAKD